MVIIYPESASARNAAFGNSRLMHAAEVTQPEVLLEIDARAQV